MLLQQRIYIVVFNMFLSLFNINLLSAKNDEGIRTDLEYLKNWFYYSLLFNRGY